MHISHLKSLSMVPFSCFTAICLLRQRLDENFSKHIRHLLLIRLLPWTPSICSRKFPVDLNGFSQVSHLNIKHENLLLVLIEICLWFLSLFLELYVTFITLHGTLSLFMEFYHSSWNFNTFNDFQWLLMTLNDFWWL